MDQKEQIKSIDEAIGSIVSLIKELRNYTPILYSKTYNEILHGITQNVTRINQNLNRIQQEVPDDDWIPADELQDSVNGRHPKIDYDCLVVYESFNKVPLVTVATPNYDKNGRDLDFHSWHKKMDLKITHWKPLPLPPSK